MATTALEGGAVDDLPAGPVARSRAAGLAIGAALVAGAAVLSLLRQQGKRSWQSFFAEDGSLLFQDLVDGKAVGHLFEAYAGYLVLTPRLLSLPAGLVPVEQGPAYFAVAGAIVVALLAAGVYRWSDGWVHSRPVRLALAALVVLAPAAGPENSASLTNTIWAFAMVVPWALLARRRGTLDVVARSAVVLLAATGTPLGLAFVPLAAVLWWRRRDRAATAVVAAYAVGAVAQVALVLAVGPADTLVPVERPIRDFVHLVGVRVYGTFLIGPDGAIDLWRRHGWKVAVGAALVVGALFVLAALGAGRRARLLGATFFVYAAVAFVGSIWRGGTVPFRFISGSLDPALYMRYSVPPTFLLASAFAVLVAPVDRPDGATGDAPAVGRWLFVAQTVLVIAFAFTVEGFRGDGPTWRESLAAKSAECEGAPPGSEIFVPADATMWLIRIPCSEVDGG